jgi:signal transduction histidine kinase
MTIVGAVALGYGVRLSRAEKRLAEQQTAEVTRKAEVRIREAVELEQARIAREMHDILAHHLSVIVAQAAAARRVSVDRAQTAADALGSIETVGRDALSGVRRLVGLLRVDRDQPDASSEPGLDGLGSLVEQVRRAGLAVELVVRGRRRPLPAEVELSALRVIQEALTNSLKHAGRTGALVTLTYGDDVLDIEVRDEGPPGRRRPLRAASDDGPAGGYGLISMHQRVAMLGGELAAGPEQGQGFRVRARLPAAGSVG